MITINPRETDHILLDMDGTLLDLKFDNNFWQVEVPRKYAELNGYNLNDARAILFARMQELVGTLRWYSVDFWSEETGLDIISLKYAYRHNIAIRDGVENFLEQARACGLRLSLLTNAHRSTIEIKFEQTGIGKYFDDVVCSHDLDAPKETPEFWSRVTPQINLRKERCIFIDDSISVLESAHQYGIGTILHVVKPDSSRKALFSNQFLNLEDFGEIVFSQHESA